MTKIYELHHYDPDSDNGIDFDKKIGVYSSEALAQQAIERLRDKPGFRDCPSGWLIEEVIVDKDTAWEQGFVTFIDGVEQGKGGQ
ncbi:MAG: hypothetical protein JSR24_08245 [Proteobacteria bacterium]|nr:hypothetical protein [Pseudomonadota bacterium]